MSPQQRELDAKGYVASQTAATDRRTPAARRALEEAEARRRLASPEAPPAEIGGRAGPEPVRYGDWEVRGLASDF